jgi:hypothetical protein
MDVDNAGDESQTKTGTHSETMIQDEDVAAYSDPVTPELILANGRSWIFPAQKPKQ